MSNSRILFIVALVAISVALFSSSTARAQENLPLLGVGGTPTASSPGSTQTPVTVITPGSPMVIVSGQPTTIQ